MSVDAETCYRALSSRDGRFDGVFYVGVTTTGIYCRPICPARIPARERCTFFDRAAEAERAGFRACFRCRPELAPGLAAVDSIPRLVRSAVAKIEAGYLNEGSIEELAGELGVSSRHLRRAMESELGVSPVELAQTCRLALAKRLLQDSAMSLAEVAFASGFLSVRRFNAAFQERFRRPPSVLRRAHGESAQPGARARRNGVRKAGARASAHASAQGATVQTVQAGTRAQRRAVARGAEGGEASAAITLRLDYRPPFAWAELLAFLRARAIPGVEAVGADEYRRTVALGDATGWIAVRADPARPALRARISLSLAPKLMEVAARLRALFDLDATPHAIAEQLSRDRLLRPLVAAAPGLRVAGAFDPFEAAIRAVLGQQVSVRAATTLSGRLVERFGKPLAGTDLPEGTGRIFPAPAKLAAAELAEVRALGMPESRARTIVELSRAIAEQRVDLSPGADPERTVERLQSLPGIGAWTAQYLAMRVLHHPNAFPAGDLALKKALDAGTAAAAEERARAWEPWRAYAVIHLWNSLSRGG